MLSNVETVQKDGVLTAYLAGEIDHHTAQQLRERLDGEILCAGPAETVLDFGGVSFMDSSGIGLILGRHKLMETLGGTLTVRNTPAQLERILKLAGVGRVESKEGEYAK
ncbi:MAG: STAS domain-containing protein [Oscillospiraceae bacterium]|nr:STAS domain-containing protein [Oscillospiraceae bacterium]